MDFDLEIAVEAGQRWLENEKNREPNRRKLAEGDVAAVESSERIKKRLERLSVAARKRPAARMAEAASTVSLIETIGMERVIGDDNFLGIGFVEEALAVSRTVGRVHIKSSSGATRGFGTGFLVSPSLLLTNHHVLSDAGAAQSSEIEFDFQRNRVGRMLTVKTFALDPGAFFLSDKALDYALVAVARTSVDGAHDLDSFGWNQLIGAEGKALLGDSLNIVQHPAAEPKQIVMRGNELVDLLEKHAHYLTDTRRGSSGSPVFNDQWELVCLHHSSVPRVEGGQVIRKDGQPWRRGVDDPDLIDWVANEGIRTSRLVAHIGDAQLSSPAMDRLRREMFEEAAPDPVEKAHSALRDEAGATVVPAPSARPQPPPSAAVTPVLTNRSASITIPLTVTVSVGQDPGAGATSATTPAAPTETSPDLVDTDEAVSIDPDYTTRKGYDARFLGGNEIVRLPWLTSAQYAQVAFNRESSGRNRHVLDYHHYSVVMNKNRQLAFFTAVNIDGKKKQTVRRESDRWILDPRIPRSVQAANDVYKSNPLDRGHLVRRLDPAWGSTFAVAKTANDDTFHWTNCSPQHERFNRNQTTWGGIENHILDSAKAHDLKVTVFTGPIFRDDDPEYRTIRLPEQYWKVVVIRKADGALSATSYLLSQASLVDAMLEEEFAFGAYRTFQVPIRTLERMTDLSFRQLSRFDPLATDDSSFHEAAGTGACAIGRFDDLVL